MRKMIKPAIAIVLAAMLISCSEGTSGSSDQKALTEFRPDIFLAEGLNQYLSGAENTTEVSFADEYIGNTETSSSTVRTGDNKGTITVSATFDEYEYGDYLVSGTFTYELPISGSAIEGYNVTTAEAAEIVDTRNDSTINLSVSMASEAVAPAFGKVTITDDITTANGIAEPMLPGTEATFSTDVGNITPADIEASIPYTKNEMASDIYSVYLANGPLTQAIFALVADQGQPPYDIALPGDGNRFTANLGSPTDYNVNLTLSSPTHFIAYGNGITYSVHTTGAVDLSATAAESTIEYDNFAASVIISENGTEKAVQSKTIDGTYSGTSMIDGSLRIGNHTYSGDGLRELNGLNIATMYIYYWNYAEIGEDGSFFNDLGAGDYMPQAPSVSGTYDATTGILKGTLSYSGTYPIEAEVNIIGTGDTARATLESFIYNGTTFDAEAVATLNDMVLVASASIGV